jgi:hypothetical protein
MQQEGMPQHETRRVLTFSTIRGKATYAVTSRKGTKAWDGVLSTPTRWRETTSGRHEQKVQVST